MTEAIALDLADAESVALSLDDTEAVSLTFTETIISLEVLGEVGPRGPEGPVGPQGVQGPVGPQGPIGGVYRHSQGAPNTVWLVEHDLGFYPAVTPQDSAGTVIYGDVEYVDTNTLTITFSAATGGFANLS